jgi:ParB family chromosome partitioning protein
MHTLVESVRDNGILQPILLRTDGDKFEVVAGHRRFKAAQMCGLAAVPACIMDDNDGNPKALAYHENIFRHDLTPIEESAAVLDMLQSDEFDIETLAAALNKSINWIAQRVAMCEWPVEVAAAVHAGKISTAAAWNLAKIKDQMRRKMLVDYAAENGATARVTAAWLQSEQAGMAQADPEDIEPGEAPPTPTKIEPYTPCVVCSGQFKMINLSFLPICGPCNEIVLAAAKELQKTTL